MSNGVTTDKEDNTINNIMKGAGHNIQLDLFWKVFITVGLIVVALIALVCYFLCNKCKKRKEDIEAPEEEAAVNGAQTDDSKNTYTNAEYPDYLSGALEIQSGKQIESDDVPSGEFEIQGGNKIESSTPSNDMSNGVTTDKEDNTINNIMKGAGHNIQLDLFWKVFITVGLIVVALIALVCYCLCKKCKKRKEDIEAPEEEAAVNGAQTDGTKTPVEAGITTEEETGKEVPKKKEEHGPDKIPEEKKAEEVPKKKEEHGPDKIPEEKKAEQDKIKPKCKEEHGKEEAEITTPNNITEKGVVLKDKEMKEENKSKIEPNSKDEEVEKNEEIMAETSTDDKKERGAQKYKYILPCAIKNKRDWRRRKRLKLRICHV
ncbi:uncharacterized protein LOC108710576 isoform X2 [Xenopus laevis]|nr:uncharacterized protein LOC108710576 isoform X2 [Xenopus laevis]XP_041442122.1 uncharacterized protein LOC108710576 isoform X2 [Xenopus laevis]